MNTLSAKLTVLTTVIGARAMSETFTYQIKDGANAGEIDVTVSTPSTDSTGDGDSYAVTAISGTIDGAAISGEVGPGGTVSLTPDGVFLSDNAIFLSDSGGALGSAYGIDNNGLVFDAGALEYNLFSDSGTLDFVSYDTSTGDESAETPVTVISTDAPCFCTGTLILTAGGERPIESLSIGDCLVTLHAGLQPIRWIGRRSYAGEFISDRPLIVPVCVKAGSLGNELPRRDLWVSPGHALYIDGALIQARLLVNGLSILQPDAGDDVCYLQIEFARHEVIFAEGVPTESFLVGDFRNLFQNATEYADLYPGPDPVMLPCAPILDQGFQLQAIRDRIATLAGMAQTLAPRGTMRGFLDIAGPDRICGWAQDEMRPEAPVCLDVLADGRWIMRVLANKHRFDLQNAGLGSGNHAFEIDLPQGVAGRIELRRSDDNALLARTGVALAALHETSSRAA
jgi:hypothetical protein